MSNISKLLVGLEEDSQHGPTVTALYNSAQQQEGADLSNSHTHCGVELITAERIRSCSTASNITRMWANAQRDGRPVEHRWRPLFNAAKFG